MGRRWADRDHTGCTDLLGVLKWPVSPSSTLMVFYVSNWDFRAIDCTPYLLQLGLTKSRTSLVWIAGPLSGLVIQPLIGVIADRSRSKYGRRRPFMIAGSLIVALCLLLLGWTSEIVNLIVKDADKVIYFVEFCHWIRANWFYLAGSKCHNCTCDPEHLSGWFRYQYR